MNNLTKALMEELTVEYVKVGPLQIPESVVISWVIMVLVVLGSILLTRNLKVDHISKRQAVLELAYTAGKNFFEGLLGKEGACYVPYLMTVAIYIAFSNLIGVFGVKQKNIFVSPVCGGRLTLSTHVALIQVATNQVVRGQFSFHHRDNFLSISRTVFCPNGGRISVCHLESFLSV